MAVPQTGPMLYPLTQIRADSHRASNSPVQTDGGCDAIGDHPTRKLDLNKMLYAAILGTIALDAWSTIIIRRRRNRLSASSSLKLLRRILFVIGLGLASLAVTITWHYTAEIKILGFPLPAAAFELWNSGGGDSLPVDFVGPLPNESGGSYWADFVGPWTLPFLAIDFALCLYLPQLLLALALLTGNHDESTAIQQADADDCSLRL